MTAKELRDAALVYGDQKIDDYPEDSPTWDMLAWRAGCVMAAHVLATVREDDDEPANWVWVGSVYGLNMTFEVDDGVTTYGLDTKPIATQFTVGCNTTRGQMRHLFAALGIELKEPA